MPTINNRFENLTLERLQEIYAIVTALPTGITSVTGVAPISSSGGTTPAISISQATTSTNGYLSSADWNTFNGKFTLPSLTSGSVLFSNGTTIAQNNSQFFWDNTNNRLGVGTSSPSNKLHIFGAASTTPGLVFTTTNRPTAMTLDYSDTSDVGRLVFNNIFYITKNGNTFPFYISANSNVLINTITDAGYKLDVNGTARVKGAGTTGSTNAFVVQNNSSINLLRVRDDGYVILGTVSQGMESLNATFSQYLISNGTLGNVFGTYTSFIASAIVQCDSTTKGFLPPRMTTTQKNAIASPAAGLVVYDTTLGKLCVRTASAWETITSV